MLTGLFLVSSAMAEPAALALLPFGTDLYLQKKPARAIVYTLTQALGVAAAVVGTLETDRVLIAAGEEVPTPWKGVTAAGVSLGGASYLFSVVDASNLHAKDGVAWMRDWDADRAALAQGRYSGVDPSGLGEHRFASTFR